MKDFAKYFNKKTIGDIKWAHAVVSIELLEKALKDPNIDFLEVDISQNDDGELIAAHFSNHSDLLIAHLFGEVKKSKKGLKIDFKYQNTIEPCLNMLIAANIKQPIILNADILALKGSPQDTIEPNYFVPICKNFYPNGLLSPGWRTNEESIYMQSDIDTMLNHCKEVQYATFPIKATLLPEHWQNSKKLIEDTSKNYTLTIWDSDPLSKDLYEWIKQNTDPQKCFYDFITST
jgi:hypothetical protein